MSILLRGAAVAAYAVASFFAFPQAAGDGFFDFGLLFAPVAPALLLAALAGLSPGRAAGVGFAAGLAAHAAVLFWIYVVVVTYGHALPLIGGIAVLGLASFVAGFVALFGAGLAALARWRLDGPFVVAAWWTAVEHLRGFAFTGFPWATLGYAWHANRPLAALLPYAGVYVLSFAAVLLGAGAVAALRGRLAAAAAALVAVAALHGAGLALAPAELPPDAGRLRVAVLQGNIQQGVKWSEEWADRTLDIYASLTGAAAAQGAEVVVWPETAVPGSPDASPDLRERLAALARRNRVTLVAGAVGVDGFDPETGERGDDLRFYDSAFVISPEGEFLERYDKAHLVPFGEYVPMRRLLGRWIKALATGVTSGDVSAGAGPRSVALPRPSGAGAVPAGVPICYELIFPDEVRRFGLERGAGRASVLLGITNDAWYGRTGAPYQFLVMTAVRAAETGTWTARAANTGVSAFIDPRGRIRERTRIFERDFLVRDLPLRPPDERGTFYVRHGDRFAQACWLAVGLAALGGGLRRRIREAR